VRSAAHSEGCLYQSLRTFSNDTSESDEHYGQQEGEYNDYDRKYGTSSYSSEPHLLTPENLNELLRYVNLSKKKQADLLGSRLKAWNLLHQDNVTCFFRNCQNEFKEFLYQENDLLFCDDVWSVIEVL
jgi:hypothetical protein